MILGKYELNWRALLVALLLLIAACYLCYLGALISQKATLYGLFSVIPSSIGWKAADHVLRRRKEVSDADEG